MFYKTRITIEHAFGLLKTRFRRLLSGLETRNLELISHSVAACCVLHNICLAQNDFIEENESIHEIDIVELNSNELHSANRAAANKREQIKLTITNNY